MTNSEYKDLLSKLSLREKAIMCAQVIDRQTGKLRNGQALSIGMEGIVHCDNPSGDMGESRVLSEQERLATHHGTTFPHMAALAATWDCETARLVGRANGVEARENGVTLLARPGINIKRSPLAGRNFEYFSEDPYLAGELAGSYIQGVQSTRTAACLKHYAVNNQEYERMTTNAVVGERALREIYLEAFRIAIQKGDPWSIMTSYNRVNGEWTSSSRHLMTEILRGEWGYDGMVQSDGLAIQTNKVSAHACGMDSEGNEYTEHTGELLDAVYQGVISEAELDAHCLRLLKLQEKVQGPTERADYEANHAYAIQVAEQAAVLLKNDGILPLSLPCQGLLVAGSIAELPPYCGCGSGHTNARVLDRGLEQITRLLGAAPAYAPGYPNVGDMEADDPALVAEAAQAARQAKCVAAFVGLPVPLETENHDRTSLALPLGQRKMLEAICEVNSNVILCVHAGAPVDLSPFIGRVRAILFLYTGGEGVGTACANLLFGLAEPGGRLPETFPLRLEDTPAFLSFPDFPSNQHDVRYDEGIYIGYRWYEARKLPVQYPFGFGLSYTTFALSDLRLSRRRLSPGERLRIRCRVTNTGTRPGSQVIQVYVKDPVHSAPRPEKELKGFGKVWLEPGESRDVEILLGDHAFSFWNENTNAWCVEAGEFEILVGDSSAHLPLKETVEVQSDDRYMRYSTMTPVEWICRSGNLEAACEGLPSSVRQTIDSARNFACAFPFYRLKFPLLGFTPISPGDMDTILYRLNTLPERHC